MLDMAWRIGSWGVEAVMARAWLSAKEIKHMTAALNVYNAYQGRGSYKDKNGDANWAEWAKNNPREANILGWAAEVANNGE